MDAFVTFGMDISLLELFMLRVSVEQRIASLEKSKKETREKSDCAYQPFTEMLEIYNPLYKKIDTEIEKRSIRPSTKRCN
jgi:hypothetical protein